MKRLVSIALILVLIFALSACSKPGTPVPTDFPEPEPETIEVPFPLESGDDIHTIAFVSDTQRYAYKDSTTNKDMIKALVDDKDKYGIEYVIHSGDLVQTPDKEDEWQVAKEAMSQLDGIIPYGVLAGNHDQDSGDERFTLYTKYFGDATYSGCDYFAGSFENCRAHAQLVTIGSNDFVVVYISDDPSKDCIEFANDIFGKYPDRIGILVTHKYLEPDLSLDEMGEYMLEKIVKPNANVKLVLCGHESVAGYLETKIDDERTVLQVMANYQDAGTKGTMMYLQINEKAKTLTGISYSPVIDSYEGYKNQSDDQFRVDLPW